MKMGQRSYTQESEYERRREIKTRENKITESEPRIEQEPVKKKLVN